jgi:hypothetical protein
VQKGRNSSPASSRSSNNQEGKKINKNHLNNPGHSRLTGRNKPQKATGHLSLSSLTGRHSKKIMSLKSLNKSIR